MAQWARRETPARMGSWLGFLLDQNGHFNGKLIGKSWVLGTYGRKKHVNGGFTGKIIWRWRCSIAKFDYWSECRTGDISSITGFICTIIL